MTNPLTVHCVQHIAHVLTILNHGLVALVSWRHLTWLENLTWITDLGCGSKLDALSSLSIDLSSIVLVFFCNQKLTVRLVEWIRT